MFQINFGRKDNPSTFEVIQGSGAKVGGNMEVQ